jgi:hypothetical protein
MNIGFSVLLSAIFASTIIRVLSVLILVIAACGATSAAAESATPSLGLPTPRIEINLSTQMLMYYPQGTTTPTALMKISSGKPSTPTPTTTDIRKPFKVVQKHDVYSHQGARAVGRELNIPHWLMLDAKDEKGDSRAIGIHSSKFCLPYPSSDGCIRLAPENAKRLYDLVQVNTPVYIIGSERDYVKSSKYPWQIEKERDLIEEIAGESGTYKFKKTLDQAMAETYVRLIQSGRLGVYHPTAAQKKSNSQWKNAKFINFPDLPQMGILENMSFDQCKDRYLTLDELQTQLKRPIVIR